MNARQRTALIVGADGMIGSALMRRWPESGWRLVGASRRRERTGEGLFYLDLSENPGSWVPPETPDAAVFCAGITRLKDCRSDPEGSSRVNVRGVLSLAENLAARGVFIVYVSTSQVFDGTRPRLGAQERRRPVTEYGRQLARVEKELSAWGSKTAVVRIAKVLGRRIPLFGTWLAELRAGRPVRPFSDMVMAPVPLRFAAQVLGSVASRRLPGIFQISGDRDVSYAQIALWLAGRLAADASLVRPVSAAESGAYDEGVLANTTFDTTRIEKELGLVPPAVWETIENAFFFPERLSEAAG